MSTTTGIGSEEGSPNSVADAETVMGGEEMEGGEEDEINSDDDERAHTNTDNTDTEDGSSVGSGGAGARVDPASYVDLTGDVFCRVVMTRKTPEGGSVPCVCGNPAVTCRRRGHKGKQSRTTSRGLARHYPALPGRTVNSTIDGRMDQGPGLTATEFRMLVQEERDEMDRLASGLEDWSAPEEEQHESRRYFQVDIGDYLDNGLLPFLVRRTYQAYVELLSTARQEAYESSLAWTDGLAKAMVEYHSTKLAETRAFASDWRDCLLGTYVYLRDAKHKSFFAESMTRSLWRQQRSLPGASSPNDTGDEDA
jgi:hypothetical protein